MHVVSSQIVPTVPSPLPNGKRSTNIHIITTAAKIPTTLAKLRVATRFDRPTPPVVGLADDAELFTAAIPLAVEPVVADVAAALALGADAANVAPDRELDVVTSPAVDVA